MPELYTSFYHIINTDKNGKTWESFIDLKEIMELDRILNSLVEFDPPESVLETVLKVI